ncbi:MAG: SgcJ/EcaC family oxidoreductase [Lacunisphaera sp.]|nr:SgcJ/EcaC family oxidoreductase [Lacunisphaera sp.]
MKTKFLSVFWFLFVICALPATEKRVEDDLSIRRIIAEQVRAWNIGDAKAFSANFSDEGSFTNIRGSVFYGHQAFEERHAEIFATFFRGSKLAMSADKIHFVRPDIAIVDISTEVSELKGMPPGVKTATDGKIHTRLQEVFVKEPTGWRIASYHNVDIKE